MSSNKHFPVLPHASDFHSGKQGGNKLAQADDPAVQAMIASLLQAWQSGKVRVVNFETHEIAKEGQLPIGRYIIDVSPA